jgi:hypothetical protein
MSRIPRAGRRALLAAHLVGGVGAIGASLALVALGVAGLSGGADPLAVYPAMHRVEAWVIRPLAVVSLGTGVVLAVSSHWGLVTYWWVTVKLAIAAVVTLAVFLLLEPALGASAVIASGLSTEPLTDAQRARFAVLPAVATVLFAVNVALGVYKPRGRIRFGRAAVGDQVDTNKQAAYMETESRRQASKENDSA